jgi:uncharacterized RDD family membrane protein YckC
MIWYYVDEGKQAGPVDDAQLEALRQSGKIGPNTYVFREGMMNWQPYHEVVGAGIPAMPANPNDGVCVECGKVFAKDQLIQHGQYYVCAQCKPAFLQKLAEGATVGGTQPVHYAGFWIRFVAVIIDSIFLWIVQIPVRLIAGVGILGMNGPTQPEPTLANLGPLLLLSLVGMVVTFGYEIFMVGKWGATLGKMAVKIKIVTADGGRVSYARATGRCFARIVSALICYIGYIMAGFDDQKKALHDMMCNTRVVYK